MASAQLQSPAGVPKDPDAARDFWFPMTIIPSLKAAEKFTAAVYSRKEKVFFVRSGEETECDFTRTDDVKLLMALSSTYKVSETKVKKLKSIPKYVTLKAAEEAVDLSEESRAFITSVVDNSDIADVLIARFFPLEKDSLNTDEIMEAKSKHIQAALRAVERAGGQQPTEDALKGVFEKAGIPVPKIYKLFRLDVKIQRNDIWSTMNSVLIDRGLVSMEGEEGHGSFQDELFIHRNKAADTLLNFAEIPPYEFRSAASVESLKKKAIKKKDKKNKIPQTSSSIADHTSERDEEEKEEIKHDDHHEKEEIDTVVVTNDTRSVLARMFGF